MSQGMRGDRVARAIGLIVFLVGLGVILVVLQMALQLFRDPDLGARIGGIGKAAPALSDIAIGFGRLAIRVGLLFLGSQCGWLIAGRGIAMYAAGHPQQPAPTPGK